MFDAMNALGGQQQPHHQQNPQNPQWAPRAHRSPGSFIPEHVTAMLAALRGGTFADRFGRQQPLPGQPQGHQGQAGQQGFPTQIAPAPYQQPFQPPQAPQNMVGQSYGVQGMRPASNGYGLPTY